MPRHFFLNLGDGDGPALVLVHLIEEEPHLFFCDLGADIVQELVELGEFEFRVRLETKDIEELTDIDVLRVYLEPQTVHDHLQFVLDLLVVHPELIEVPSEDGMLEHLVPFYALLLGLPQRFPEEVLSLAGEALINDQRLLLDVLDELVHRPRSPGRSVMQYLVKHEPDCPNIALAAVRLALEQFQRHVERRPNRSLILHLPCDVLLSEAKVRDLEFPTRDEYIGWLHVSTAIRRVTDG